MDRALTGLVVSLDDVAAGCLALFTGVGDVECSTLDGFLSDVVFDAPAAVPSALFSAAVSLPELCDGWTCVVPEVELDDAVLAAPATELDGVVSVAPATEPDVVVVVEPVVDPDELELVLDVVDVSEVGTAQATPGERAIAEPMPKATANAPTRPT